MTDTQSASIPGLIALFSKILFVVSLRSLTSPFRWRSPNKASTLYRDVTFAAVRTMLRHASIAQFRALMKGTTETYYEICKNIEIEPKSEDFGNVTGHWIGNQDADLVILYFHGGGYTQPCTVGHMQYLVRLVKDLNARLDGKSTISVLLPAYNLAPEVVFPRQLQQATTVLSCLLKDRSPASIIVSGDSAGGGLAFSLLYHILHPHPDVPEVTLSAPLKGALLYSPEVSFDTTFPSFTTNAVKDTIDPNILHKWAPMYLGQISDGDLPVDKVENSNEYAELLLAETSKWEGLRQVAEEVFIWAGEDEVFLDSIRATVEKVKDGWKFSGGNPERLKVVVGIQEAHIAPILDVTYDYKEKGASQVMIEEWLMEQLN